MAPPSARKKTTAKRVTPRRRRATPGATPRVIPGADPRRPAEIHSRLRKLYPDARCALNHRDAFELLAATILSAQCTDARVNLVTPALFAQYPDAAAMSKAKPADLEVLIRSTGFYRNKAKSLLGAAKLIVEKFGGQVPATMEELTQLPGVARKTANVVLGNVYGKNEGFVVDTHISRLSQRLGLSRHTDPVKIEQDLMALFPRDGWTLLAHLLIFHGRRVCVARKPRCEACALAELCPKVGVA